MRSQALGALFHSPVCPPAVKEAILKLLVADGAIEPEAHPPVARVYPPVGAMALDIFFDELLAEAESFQQIARRQLVSAPADAVIRRPDILESLVSDRDG
jgi:hypothetical protein